MDRATYAHISYDSFITSARQTIGFDDVLKGLLKVARLRVIIALVGAYQGFGTRGGAAGVGQSTTGAVVISIILIFISNFVLSFVLFGVNRTCGLRAPRRRLARATATKVVLQNCTLDIVEGAITCIIGLSGAGKSTILRLLDGLRKPDSGHVYVQRPRHLRTFANAS